MSGDHTNSSRARLAALRPVVGGLVDRIIANCAVSDPGLRLVLLGVPNSVNNDHIVALHECVLLSRFPATAAGSHVFPPLLHVYRLATLFEVEHTAWEKQQLAAGRDAEEGAIDRVCISLPHRCWSPFFGMFHRR